MKKYWYLLFMILFLFSFGCEKRDFAKEFKDDYESINGKENAGGKIHRSVELSSDNLFEEITPAELLKKIENEETFYVYFGSRLCPWCRSSIEMADKVSRDNGIEKIYYIDIWDDDGKEIFRDKYSLNQDNKPELVQEGVIEYKKILEKVAAFTKDYTLTDESGEVILTGEKRIFAPNYFYFQKGECKRMTTGVSSLQKDSREKLTEEMLKEEQEMFNDFFLNYCDDLC